MCRLGAAACALLLAACSGGGGSDTPASVPLSGTVSFDLVPVLAGGGLDYAATEAQPVRGGTVELVSEQGEVLASTRTDEQGRYSVSADPNTLLLVRAKAELARTGMPSWSYQVRDNTNANALYALDGAVFNTGTSAQTVDLHAASGWDQSTSSYAETRAAAPFAILDAVYDAVQLVLAAEPTLAFPALDIYWSPDNVPNLDAGGNPNLSSGEIGTSFFALGLGIYLLGAEDEDTDEYDRHVITHEWAHHFENAFSRTDNIGGPHALIDQLDLRVAFSEGFANAFSAMVTGDSIYRDADGPRQARAGSFDVEDAAFVFSSNPGWFSEISTQEILYDLFDANQDSLEDVLALGFAPLYEAFADRQVNVLGLTSIFTFIDALKQNLPLDAAAIDGLVDTQSIAAVVDEFGSNEQNAGFPSSNDVLPIYRDLTVNAGPVNVCSIDDFRSSNTGSVNKLGSRQFLKFSVTTPGTHTILVRATEVPQNEQADPDLVLHRRGSFAISQDDPGVDCTAQTPLACEERMSLSLGADDYVLEVYEWSNTAPEDAPIGRTCFDVEVTL